jgi:hypothetical protein
MKLNALIGILLVEIEDGVKKHLLWQHWHLVKLVV